MADIATGALHSQQLYKAWGESRYASGTLPTRYTYTGQYSYANDFRLVFYGSRFYDPLLSRWASPDSIIPSQTDPISWDRFSYVFNNPVRYNDPSGHCPWCIVGALVGAAVGYGAQVYNNYQNGVTGSAAWIQNISAEPIVGGALIGAGAVMFAPAVVAAAGDVLVGAGVATGSMALFGVGMSAYGASSTLTNTIMGTTAVQDIMDDGLSVAEGEFSVWDWSAYPQGSAPKPAGPFRLLDGDEYATARAAADRANTALHQRNPAFNGLQIHEIHPVKFGGNPTDLSNKIPLTRLELAQYTTWWNMLQRSIDQ